MLNKKGMTLIEVVIAIAILSIGATVLYSGFTTIARMMIDSQTYTRNVNNQFSALNGKIEENGTRITESDTNITIKVEGKEIDVKGTLAVAKSEVDTVDTLNLKKIKLPETEEKSAIDSIIDDWNKFLIDQAMLQTMDARKAHFAKLLEEKGLPEPSGRYLGLYSNDSLNQAYYLEYCDYTNFPILETVVVDACNKIYDNDHPEPIANPLERSVRMGGKQYYIHAYIAKPDELSSLILAKNGKVSKEEMLNYVIYYAVPEPTNANTYQWRIGLTYVITEKAWYYKRFAPGNGDKNSFITLNSYQHNDASSLFLEVKDTTKWQKIK